jgi:hypothetical protein
MNFRMLAEMFCKASLAAASGDVGVKSGKLLHHAGFGERLLVRPTFMADTHRFLPIQGMPTALLNGGRAAEP